MSPRLSALEEKKTMQDSMDLLEMKEEGEKVAEFVIGTEPEVESEKGNVEGDVFETPQQGKKKIVAAKSAAAGGAASSVEWPLLQETAEKLNLKPEEELRKRLEFERSEKELQEMKALRKRLDGNETEMKRFREEAARDKEKLREKSQMDIGRKQLQFSDILTMTVRVVILSIIALVFATGMELFIFKNQINDVLEQLKNQYIIHGETWMVENILTPGPNDQFYIFNANFRSRFTADCSRILHGNFNHLFSLVC